MSSEELLREIEAAEQAFATALARSKSASHGTPQAELVALRDAVSLASMKLVRLRGRWEREFSQKWLHSQH